MILRLALFLAALQSLPVLRLLAAPVMVTQGSFAGPEVEYFAGAPVLCVVHAPDLPQGHAEPVAVVAEGTTVADLRHYQPDELPQWGERAQAVLSPQGYLAWYQKVPAGGKSKVRLVVNKDTAWDFECRYDLAKAPLSTKAFKTLVETDLSRMVPKGPYRRLTKVYQKGDDRLLSIHELVVKAGAARKKSTSMEAGVTKTTTVQKLDPAMVGEPKYRPALHFAYASGPGKKLYEISLGGFLHERSTSKPHVDAWAQIQSQQPRPGFGEDPRWLKQVVQSRQDEWQAFAGVYLPKKTSSRKLFGDASVPEDNTYSITVYSRP